MSTNPRTAMHAAMAAQQATINALAAKVAVQDVLIDYVANLAGISEQVTAIRKKADADNPAQPVPNPASEQAFETTEQAVTPETRDNATVPGQTPGSVNNLSADTTDVALNPGASLPTAPFNDLQNVQAPVAGTETQLPLDQTRIETDVRVGDPMNLEQAYPWTIASNRTTASIRLARLQIAAGLAEINDDLALGARIEASKISNAEIESTIKTLESVRTAARQGQPRPGNLVPRSASVQRTTPSLAGDAGGFVAQASVLPVGDDTADSDLFD